MTAFTPERIAELRAHWADAQVIASDDPREFLNRSLEATHEFVNLVRTVLPETLDEVERLARENAAWREMMPRLDRLASLLDVCEGVSQISAAIHEIERLRDENADLQVRLRGAEGMIRNLKAEGS